jgi:hypothetical protein
MSLFALILEDWLVDGVAHRRVIKVRLIKFVLNVRELSKKRRNASNPWQQSESKEPVKKVLDRKNGPELIKHSKTKTLRDSNNSAKWKNVDDKKKKRTNNSSNRRKRKGPTISSKKKKKKSVSVERLKSTRPRPKELVNRKRKNSTDINLRKNSADINLRKRPDNSRYEIQIS